MTRARRSTAMLSYSWVENLGLKMILREKGLGVDEEPVVVKRATGGGGDRACIELEKHGEVRHRVMP